MGGPCMELGKFCAWRSTIPVWSLSFKWVIQSSIKPYSLPHEPHAYLGALCLRSKWRFRLRLRANVSLQIGHLGAVFSPPIWRLVSGTWDIRSYKKEKCHVTKWYIGYYPKTNLEVLTFKVLWDFSGSFQPLEWFHLPLKKMAAISWTILSDVFLWMKSFEFWLKFHWSLFLRV